MRTLTDTVAGIDLTYSYDPLDRLTGVSGTYTRTYDYDPLGNLTNKAGVTQYYTGTRPHAVTSTSDGKAFDYNANGNMTDRDGQTLTWDAENRLTEVVSDATTVRFSYDGQGHRVGKEVVVDGQTVETTIYVGPHFEVAISGTQTISTQSSSPG